MDPASAAALYLRAAFLTEPASSGTTERDAAIADLEKACEVVEAGSRTAKDVETLLRELKRLRRVGRANDKAYGGMFDRGAVYGEDEPSRRRAADARAKKDEAATADDSRSRRGRDGRCRAGPGRERSRASALIAEYERTGQHEKAASGMAAQARAKLERARAVQRADAALTSADGGDGRGRVPEASTGRPARPLSCASCRRSASSPRRRRARARRRRDARAEAARMTTAQSGFIEGRGCAGRALRERRRPAERCEVRGDPE